MNETIRRLVIRGHVQGVGYRAWVEHLARHYRVEGWVRNRKDGSVEAVFSGSSDVVARVISDCRTGPSLARVGDVDEQTAVPDELKLRPSGEWFAVLPTIERSRSFAAGHLQ